MGRIYTTGFQTGTIDQVASHTNVGGEEVQNSTTRGAWSNYALKLGSGGGATDFIPQVSEYYCGFGFRSDDPTLGDSGITFMSPNAVHQARFVTKSGGQMVIRRGDTATVLATGTIVLSANTWYYLEVYLKIDDTGGKCRTWINGLEDIPLTTGLDTKYDGASGVVDRLSYLRSGNLGWWDDVYVNDLTGSVNNGRAGDRQIKALIPNGAGSHTGLTPTSGANYTCVDERPPNFTDYVFSSTPDDYDLYALPDESNVSIAATRLWTYAEKGDGGSGLAAPVLKTGAGTNTGADQALSTSPVYYHQDYDVDPNDSNPWSLAKVNATEVGWKAR